MDHRNLAVGFAIATASDELNHSDTEQKRACGGILQGAAARQDESAQILPLRLA